MLDIAEGDILLLDDGRSVVVTDIPEGNEDAPEDLILVTTLNDDIFVINPFQIDAVIKP